MADRSKWGMLWGAMGLVVALTASACGFGGSGSKTILVDYEHDDFATQFIRFFPDQVKVHPGETINFRQAWTGEPHTVTFGTVVNEVLEVTRPLIEKYGDRPEDEVPPKVLKKFFKAESKLPTAFQEEDEEEGPAEGEDEATAAEAKADEEESDGESIPGTVAQPCFVPEGGELPEDGGTCEERDLPEFTGTELYYNSGIIPFEGPQGNDFELKLADDIAPGKYLFVCAVHGSFQSGVLEVVPEDQEVPSQEEVNALTREQVNEFVNPLEKLYRDAQDGRVVLGGETHTGNFSGLVENYPGGLVNEFIPNKIETTVGEPVTWRIFGPHTISFDVPEYFPIVEFLDDGTVRYNEKLEPPAGGAPEIPEPKGPPRPMKIDGGSYDGEGFWSSGLFYGDPYLEYTLRFAEPGNYRYACLIHPPMVGTVVVKE